MDLAIIGNYEGTSESPNLCPGLGEPCRHCCANSSYICFNKICQICYRDNRFICSSFIHNQEMLLTATQIAMSAALILGIITIIILLFKICSSAGHRPILRRRNRAPRDSVRSTDTIQQIISERLRDAPPAYTRQTLPPPGDTPPPYSLLQNNQGHINACFDPDYNAPPPTYSSISTENIAAIADGPKPVVANTEELPKSNDESIDTTIHI